MLTSSKNVLIYIIVSDFVAGILFFLCFLWTPSFAKWLFLAAAFFSVLAGAVNCINYGMISRD